MTAKDFLSQAHSIDKRINSKLEQVESLRNLAEKATSTLSDIPPSGSRNLHRIEDIITKIVDLENEINTDIDCLVDLKREIVTAIKRVGNSDLQMLLELRYLCFKTWEEISVTLNWSIR